MGSMTYLIGGYAVFIGVTLVYVYSLVSRQKKLQKEMDMLQALQKDE